MRSLMATEVKLPRLGQGMESGVIVRWLKAEGDAVSQGDPLYELDTDKVTQEVEAEVDGVLTKIVVPEGEVEVGTTVAVIGTVRRRRRAGRGRPQPRRRPSAASEPERGGGAAPESRPRPSRAEQAAHP